MPFFSKKDKKPTQQDDLQIAQQALQKNDLKHALYHIGLVLGEKPDDAAAHALLNEALRGVNQPINFVPAQENMHYSTAILRATLLARQGRMDEAVQLWGNVTQILTDARFLGWLADWLDSPQKLGNLSPRTMIFALAVMNGRIPDDGYNTPPTRTALAKMLPTLRALWEKYPEAGPLGGMIGVLYRKLGHMDEAVEIGKLALQRDANRMTATNYATTLRVKGDYEQAITAFKLALELGGPIDDANLWLDIGDCYELLGQSTPALQWYEKVLAGTPDHAWAKPHALYHRFLLHQDMAALNELGPLTQTNQQAAVLMRRLNENRRPYFDFLPSPSEALINAVQQIMAKGSGVKGQIKMGLSSIEAPSAIYSTNRLLADKYGTAVYMTVSAEPQHPDPRVPLKPIKYLLWRYPAGQTDALIDPQPALPPPQPTIQTAIGALAIKPYTLASWRGLAAQLAAEIGPTAIPDLLAVMVHPPAPPEAFAWWDWMLRVQVAAALVIAQTESGWQNSERREALRSLAYGPMDWSVGAGIFALTLVAMDDPAIMRETLSIFKDLVHNLPQPGYVPYEDVLRACLDHIEGEESSDRGGAV